MNSRELRSSPSHSYLVDLRYLLLRQQLAANHQCSGRLSFLTTQPCSYRIHHLLLARRSFDIGRLVNKYQLYGPDRHEFANIATDHQSYRSLHQNHLGGMYWLLNQKQTRSLQMMKTHNRAIVTPDHDKCANWLRLTVAC